MGPRLGSGYGAPRSGDTVRSERSVMTESTEHTVCSGIAIRNELIETGTAHAGILGRVSTSCNAHVLPGPGLCKSQYIRVKSQVAILCGFIILHHRANRHTAHKR